MFSTFLPISLNLILYASNSNPFNILELIDDLDDLSEPDCLLLDELYAEELYYEELSYCDKNIVFINRIVVISILFR